MYKYEQAHEASLKYFSGENLPTDVFLNKYCLKDNDDVFYELTPDDMHNRLASEIARIDTNYESKPSVPCFPYPNFPVYKSAFANFARLVPQGSPMAAVGNTHQILSASNCVVIESPPDSIDGIMETASELAQLYKRRCGVGVDVSTLRPNGMGVKNAARKTSGPCSFAGLYSDVTRLIGQDGRRGALMITMSVHHPDVEEFAGMKADDTKVTGANVSVRLTNEFMQAVAEDKEYEQRWPCEDAEPKIRRMVRARQVWDTIIKYATETADPGLQFWDTACEMLPAHMYPRFKTRTSNPCSEIFLSAYDACRLLSINLTGYILEPFIEGVSFDFKSFIVDVHLAMRTLDNLVDIELELVQRIIDSTDCAREKEIWRKLYESGEKGRRTGLGTHGLADSLAQLRIKYDTEESLEMCDKIYETLRNEAYRASINLAKERGAFPDFDWNIHKENKFIKQLPQDIRDEMAIHGIRNISILTNAPTGTTSLVSKCGKFDTRNISSGIEPVYRLSYTRRKKINPNDQESRVDHVDKLGDKWQEYEIYHGNLKNYMDMYPGSEIPEYFVTSDKIDWEFRVRLQGVIQKYIDHSISSTINLPRGTTTETVSKIYLDAWKYGLKGITVYVDGSKDGVLITKEVDVTKRPKGVVRMEAPSRPKSMPCDIHRVTVKGKKWIVLVGLMDGEPYEIFGGYYEDIAPCTDSKGVIEKAKKGQYDLIFRDGKSIHKDIIDMFNNQEYGWATRLVSVSLRHGTPIEFLVEQLTKDGKLNDFNKVLGRVLKKYIKDGRIRSSVCCTECTSTNLEWKDGCPLCLDCGNYKCG